MISFESDGEATAAYGDPDLRRRLLDLINAAWTTQAIAVSVELRIPDLLATGARDAATLARACACHAPSLHRLLRALASLGIVEHRGDDTFALTPAGGFLRTEIDDSLAWWSLLCGGRLWSSWSGLGESVRTGRSTRRRAGGSDDFAVYENDRGAGDAFNRAMSNLTKPIAEAIVSTIDFSGIDRMVDVGGGHGTLISVILAAYPDMRGVLFDLDHAISAAGAALERAGVADRCELVCGSFFESVPGEADGYLLKSVLHDWDDEHCLEILQRCARAMRGGRAPRLFVIERIRSERVEDAPRDRAIARSDLNMLVSLGGRERTEKEYRALLDSAALRIVHISDLTIEFSVIEARIR
jgi:hypothetical protein